MQKNTQLTDEWGAFTAVPNEVIDAAMSDKAFRLFVILRKLTNSQTGSAFPGYDSIMTLTGWSRASIATAIRELEKDGWLTRQKRYGKSTVYTLKRQSSKNQTTDENSQLSKNQTVEKLNCQSSKNETTLQYITKTENIKTENRRERKAARQPDPFYESFREKYEAIYECPYRSKKGDFVQLADCRSQGGDWLTLPRWSKAVEHYFSSDLGNHTLADLASRFGAFFRAPLDRYGKPIGEVNGAPKQYTSGADIFDELRRQLVTGAGGDSARPVAAGANNGRLCLPEVAG